MIVGYAQPGKSKSAALLDAFLRGCPMDGKLDQSGPAALYGRSAAFFGVVGIEHLLRQAQAEASEWFYGDNAFFDVSRGSHFRFARNELQVNRLMPPDWKRFAALALKVRDWQRGSHIVVVEQSPHFMQLTGFPSWLCAVTERLRELTDRPLRIRQWGRAKETLGRTLQQDLEGAWALVTSASAAAVEALLAGVPAFVTGHSAAEPMAAGPIEDIETPLMPEGREEWAAGLAGMQWTLPEIREGAAWRALVGR